MKRFISAIVGVGMSTMLCAKAEKMTSGCNELDPEMISFVVRVVSPLAHLYELTDQELIAVRAVVDWSQTASDGSDVPMVSTDALACAVEKVSHDEVMAKMLCLMHYADADSKHSAHLLKRSQACSCPCPAVEDFLGGRPFVVCNVLAEKIATDQLLTSNTACFNGPVNFATSVCGIPGGFCWEPVLCPEWTGALDVLPTSCLPTCGKVILNSFATTGISRAAFGYQSKDGVNERCRLKGFVDLVNLFSILKPTGVQFLQLFDANNAVVQYAGTIEGQAVTNDSDCFIALSISGAQVMGSFDQDSCIGFERLAFTQ